MSTPWVGSSSTSKFGLFKIARANNTRCISPPESFCILLLRKCEIESCSSAVDISCVLRPFFSERNRSTVIGKL